MKRVLLADDNANLLAQLGLALREAGYQVTTTNSGADAICLLGNKPPPDLLILDMAMPGMDGCEVLKSLGPTAPPVIIITGDASALDVNAAKIARVLRKPFNLTQLMETVTSVFNPTPGGSNGTS